jgi:hypothetical protein
MGRLCWLVLTLSSAAGCTNSCPSSAHAPCGDQTIATQDTAGPLVAQNGTGAAAKGSLDPEIGINWYAYNAQPGVFEHVDPEIYLHAPEVEEVCVYMDCQAPCPSGTEPATAPNGAAGCCARGTYQHFQIVGCNNDNVNVWMSVTLDHATECNACIGYELDYNW